MGMKVGEEGAVKSEPNVVPMIDIMLVLLIIFMIVTPVISAGFQAQMPMGKNIEKSPEDQGDIVLGMDSEGCFYLDPGTGETGYMPGCPTNPDDPARLSKSAYLAKLQETLRQVYENRTKDKIMYFKADRELAFGDVQEAIEIARAAGVRVLATVTEEIREEAGLLGRVRR